MTGRWSARVAFLCLLAGFFCVLCLPYIYHREVLRFSAAERHFANPVPVPGGIIRLRKDGYGKGHFGASRNKGRKHKGIDISAPVGQPVLASKSGRITASMTEKGYGDWLEIAHPDGLLTRYAHLSARYVRTGEWVHTGQRIGAVGKTGNAANPHILPHLHYEIRYKSHALNPLENLLDPKEIVIS